MMQLVINSRMIAALKASHPALTVTSIDATRALLQRDYVCYDEETGVITAETFGVDNTRKFSGVIHETYRSCFKTEIDHDGYYNAYQVLVDMLGNWTNAGYADFNILSGMFESIECNFNDSVLFAMQHVTGWGEILVSDRGAVIDHVSKSLTQEMMEKFLEQQAYHWYDEVYEFVERHAQFDELRKQMIRSRDWSNSDD